MTTTYTQLRPYSVTYGNLPAVGQAQPRNENQSSIHESLWNFGYHSSSTSTITIPFKNRLEIQDLGWNQMMAFETRQRLESFAEDWKAPGMEAYDDL